MPKFEHKDVVKCINNDGVPSLVVGMNYPVNNCTEHYVWLDLRAEYGTPSLFNPERFEITNEEVTYQYPVREAYPWLGDEENSARYSDINLELAKAKHLLERASVVLEDCFNCELAEEIAEFLERQ